MSKQTGEKYYDRAKARQKKANKKSPNKTNADRKKGRGPGNLAICPGDASETRNLSKHLGAVLPTLERFIQYRDEDPAAEELNRWHAALDEVLPKEGVGAEETLRILREVAIPHGSRDGAPGFAGWVTTVSTVVPLVAGFCGGVFGEQRTGLHSANFLESLALEWLKQLLGIPADYQGVFTSGGSTGLLLALGAARQFAGELRGVDTASDGVAKLKKPRVYASQEMHRSIGRAGAVLGFGRSGVIGLPANKKRQLDVKALRERLRHDKRSGCLPVAVVANAGSVNTGAVDPIREILDVCRAASVWLVIDGAYGLFGLLDPEAAALFEGASEADALVVDPHKWLAVPQGCGAVFIRERQVLKRAFKLEDSPYLRMPLPEGELAGSQADGRGNDFDDFTIELSARARGVTVWAALKEIGAAGMRERVRRHNSFARHLAARVGDSPVLELCAPVTLSICCFRYVPRECRGRSGVKEQVNQLNREILVGLHNEHHHVPSGTELDGKFVIRACYLNPRTTLEDVDGLADAVLRIGDRLWHQKQRNK